MLGAVDENPRLEKMNFVGVTIGTGLGFAVGLNGKIQVNKEKTPLTPIWNKPYKDSISEAYVSGTAIRHRAYQMGYYNYTVKEIASLAREGDNRLKTIFNEVGTDLGILMNQNNQNQYPIVIGGQVSLSWDLLEEGFKGVCPISISLIKEPTKCALLGIQKALWNKGDIYSS